ncbi:MAG: signal peptidase II [Eubacteriales bacterium]|nr:signal peptidase II [Eubacteriales bacterium]
MIYLKTIARVIIADTMGKEYIRNREEEDGVKTFPMGIELRRLENPGAACGIGKEDAEAVTKCSAAVLAGCGLLLAWEAITKKKRTVRGLGLSLLVGGGLCNVQDRLAKGTVTDYIRLTRFPIKYVRELVFNLSDFCIFIGAILFAVGGKFRIKPEKALLISENEKKGAVEEKK